MPTTTPVANRSSATSAAEVVSDTHATAALFLDAAQRLFADLGYDATSVAAIAREVGVVEGALYRHFPSKRDLLHRVIAAFYEPLIASAIDGLADITSPIDQVRFLIRRQLEAMTEDPQLCRLIISEARSFDDYYDSEVAALSRRYTSLLTTAFSEGVEQGVFRDDISPHLVRDLIYGSIEHLTWSAISGHRSVDIEATTAQLVAVVSSGIQQLAPVTVPIQLELVTRRLEAAADKLTTATLSTSIPSGDTTS
jgi:TetR/AcrR family transcriptional regulator, fatty acid metabolism regulator protein